MREYKVIITETLNKNITVKADSIEDAMNQVKCLYLQEDIVLDSSDHVLTELCCLGEIMDL